MKRVISLLTVVATIASAGGAQALPALSSGIDIAGHQHPGGAAIDWHQVANSSQDFAFIKATEGVGFANTHFPVDVKEARGAGLHVGAYHYARPGTDAKAQARYFADVIKQADTSLPPVLDLEETDGLGVTALQNWTRDFLSETQRLTGKTPMIYTYRYFWYEQMGNTKEFSQYPLWLAAWQNTPPADIPGGWSYMTFWQRSDHGRVSGILNEVDLNLFNGTRGQLNAYAAGNALGIGTLLQPTDNFGGPDFGGTSQPLAHAILGIAEGNVLASAELVDAATKAGIDLPKAFDLARVMIELSSQNKLPVEDLKTMAASGKYTLGDLLILLDNSSR